MNELSPFKTVCQLDEHGFFIHTTQAELDTFANDGSYLIPAGCVETAPPEDKQGYIAQWQAETQTWAYLENHTGKTAYHKETGEAVVIQTFGALPEYLTFQKPPTHHHHFSDGKWQLSAHAQSALLAEQRQIMRDKINALRDKKIEGGVYIPSINKWIDTDAVAERNILSLKATFDLLGEQVKEIPWTFADNSVAMIDKDKLLVIWAVLMQAKTGNHANALKHKAAIEQSENPLEYDYSAGWTQTYAEFLAENAQIKEQTAA